MNGQDFENQVRRLVRIRWNLAEGEGGSAFINGQEIDAVCRTEDVVNLVMCTVERKLDKVESDVRKLVAARDYLFRTERETAVGWLITYHEPTPDQRKCALKEKVKIQSLDEFQRKLIDVEEYFSRRRQYQFGSATDPETESRTLADDEYVPCTLSDAKGAQQSVKSLARLLEDKKVVVLTADFGSGKSLTVREVFFTLCQRYRNADHKLVPLAINLREHWGQGHLAEVLERHARAISYPNPHQLVRAWNAGLAIALLDGFDELAVQPLVNSSRSRKAARRAATEIIRLFVQQARGQCGVLITGRAQYFDSPDEMRSSLDLRPDDVVLTINPFTEDQATKYLRRKGVDATLPNWLPRTPLLLGYLAARRMLPDLSDLAGYEDPVIAWDAFLDRIFSRDSRLSQEYDATTIRRLMERLSTRTRLSVGGTRELDDADLAAAFRDVTSLSAFDATNVMLQRLPGLTSRTAETGHRSFVDPQILEVLRGSDLRHYLNNPFEPFSQARLHHPLSRFGCDVAARLALRDGISLSKHAVAAKEAGGRWEDGTLATDCLVSGGLRPDSPLDCRGLTVEEADIDELDTDEVCLANVTLRKCVLRRLVILSPTNGLRLESCLIEEVEGVTDPSGLPDWVLNCEVTRFDSGATTAALMTLPVPLPVKVCLTILKKLYVQKGSGRQENAFWRGLDYKGQGYVKDVLDLLKSEGMAVRTQIGGTPVWHPVSKERPRAFCILSAPLTCGDPLVNHVAALGK